MTRQTRFCRACWLLALMFTGLLGYIVAPAYYLILSWLQ